MSLARMNNIGAFVKNVDGIPPTAAAAGTVTGTAINRAGFESCSMRLALGAATGTPTSFTADCKLQDSADGSTGWADISGAASTTLTAASTGNEKDVDLTVARAFIRAVQVTAFVGGSSPTIPVAVTVTLGGAKSLPA